jgi:hypothetical protein
MATLYEETGRLTRVGIVASVVLIGPAILGIGATTPLVVALFALSGGLAVVRDSLPTFPTVAGYDLQRCRGDLWIGSLAGAVGAAVVLGASSAELQAIGGVFGAVAMANYFVRPLYLSVISMARRTLG